jgi:2-aminoadipate transaminase
MIELPNRQVSFRSGILELKWGQPDFDLLPVAQIRQAAVQAMEAFGVDALSYGAPQGAGVLVRWLVERIGQTESRTPQLDELMLTGGISITLDQICTLCTRPGDVVLAESPAYHLALNILRDHPVDLVPAPTDDQGLRIDALADIIARLRREGRPPRLLYTIPTFNNPTGISLPNERRRALVDLAANEGLLIVEDDVYRELHYDGPPPPSLWELAPPGVVARMGSFAKSLAPGIRLGWLTADAALVRRFVEGGVLDSGGSLNHFTSLVVAQFCRSGEYDALLERYRMAYRTRRDALLSGLSQHMPDTCSSTHPSGGYFVWMRLPEHIDAETLLPHAEAMGVSFVPGTLFYLDDGGHNALRLAFSLYPPDELTEGARRLGAALKAALKS